MAPNKCAYFMCNYTSDQKPMFRFPVRDPARLKVWLSNCGNMTIANLTDDELRNRYICIVHFEKFYVRNEGGKRTRITKLALPKHYKEEEDEEEEEEEKEDKEEEDMVILPHSLIPSTTDSNKLEDPLDIKPPHRTPQCRFCAVFSKDCVGVTDNDRPYLTRNKTALTLNDLSVEVDFNDDALPKTVCRACDSKLLVMFDFLKHVKEAQDSLINVRDYVKEDIGNLTVKTECESPTPEDNDDDIINSRDGIVDSLIVSGTEFVIKPINKYKRKSVEDTPKTQKKPKVTKNVEIKSKESELIMINNKEETADVDAYEAEKRGFNDTKTVTKSSELELATRVLVNKISENEMVRCINE